jgi:cyanate permease
VTDPSGVPPYAATATQAAWLVGAWLLLFALPAFRIRAHARRSQNPAEPYWFWSTLVLLGPLGVFAYWQDRKIRRRKGELYPGET